jgi:hypothetical protein
VKSVEVSIAIAGGVGASRSTPLPVQLDLSYFMQIWLKSH